jgi:hypothetical protein
MQYQASDELTEQVKRIMKHHRGKHNKILRVDLVTAVFGEYSDTLDRKVRDAISTIEEPPIISTAKNDGGYWIPANDQEVDDFADEMLSRNNHIYRRVNNARRYVKRNQQPIQYQQERLIEVRV